MKTSAQKVFLQQAQKRFQQALDTYGVTRRQFGTLLRLFEEMCGWEEWQKDDHPHACRAGHHGRVAGVFSFSWEK
jgi:hypothetical protein